MITDRYNLVKEAENEIECAMNLKFEDAIRGSNTPYEKLFIRKTKCPTTRLKHTKYNTTEGENTMADKGDLYKVVTGTEEKYGTYLATDAKGRYVLEMKGTNNIQAFDKKELEEILPETIGVRFVENGWAVTKVYHYLRPETSTVFEVGDLLLLLNERSGKLVEVVEVGAQSKTAFATFAGWVVAKAANRFS